AGWSSDGVGSSPRGGVNWENGHSKGTFALISGASAYGVKREPSFVASDGYASIPLSWRYARIDCCGVSPICSRITGLVHVCPFRIQVSNSWTTQNEVPEHGRGVARCAKPISPGRIAPVGSTA